MTGADLVTAVARPGHVCAYCGAAARFRVSTRSSSLVGFVCGEPTHWLWVIDSIIVYAEGRAA